MSLRTVLKPLYLSTAALAVSSSSFALAQNDAGSVNQEVAASNEDETQNDTLNDAEDVIVVTGTNIRGVRSVGSPGTVINRQDIEDSGLTTASQVLQTLPQVQSNSSFSNEQPGQANPYVGSPITGGGTLFNNESRGSSVDIRGLGPNATLVLVDGRRLPSTGTVASFSEANILPLAAIERIEVITDGASAVYGSNAIGGVVNYITRKDYSGIEFSSRVTLNDLYEEYGGSLVIGQGWSLGDRRGRAIVSYDYRERSNVAYDADPRIRTDLTSFGGGNALFTSYQQPAPTGNGYYLAQACPPPAFYLPDVGLCFNPDFTPGFVNEYFDVTGFTPSGAPTSESSSGFFPSNSLADTDALRDYVGKSNNHAVNVYLTQEVTNNLSLFYQGSYSKRSEKLRNFDVYSLTMTEESPFFPIDAPAGNDSVIVPVGVATTPKFKSESEAHTLGGNLEIEGGWQVEAYASLATSHTGAVGISGRGPDSDILQYMIESGTFNPFLGLTEEVRNAATYQGPKEGGSRAKSKSFEAVLRANGSLFDLPGGTVRTAIGVQYSDLENDYVFAQRAVNPCLGLSAPDICEPIAPVPDPERSRTDSRTIKAIYGELYVPIIGKANALPLVDSLALSLAGRWEEYSDFGQTFNPRVGLTWDITDGVRARGSWGTAFRAPNLIELSTNSIGYVGPGANNAGPDYGVEGPTQVVIRGGGNPDLDPETSTNLTFGLDLEPVSGMRISATYYRIKYTDKIVALPVGLFLQSPTTGALYDEFITPIAVPAPSGCLPSDPSTWAPEVQEVLPDEARTDGVCAATQILDGRWVNAAKVVQDGIDIEFNYGWKSAIGNLNLGLSMSKILGIDEQIVAGFNTKPEPLNRIFRPVDLRLRGSLGWSNGNWSGNLFVNYTPSYTNDLPITPVDETGTLATLPVKRVDSWTTADMGISYSFPTKDSSITNGLRLNLNIQNVTDEAPPLVLVVNQAFDARMHSLYGRTWTIQLTKAF